jgi:hypothetical protein
MIGAASTSTKWAFAAAAACSVLQASEYICFALALGDQLSTGLALRGDGVERAIGARRPFVRSAAIHHSLTVRLPVWRTGVDAILAAARPRLRKAETTCWGWWAMKRKDEPSA